MKQVLVLNGPNLGRLGAREPDVYGTQTFDDLAEACRITGRTLDLHVEVRQTDDEAELIGCSPTTPMRCATRWLCAPRR